MEQLSEQLYKLFVEELSDLNRGLTPNRKRINKMKFICQVLVFLRYVDLPNRDLLQIINTVAPL